jgi:hypothetical protein
MSKPVRRIATLAALWVASLLIVATIVRAQVHQINPLPEPKVVFGPDFGIRIEAEQNGVPVGPLVVKINDKWVEVRVGSTKGPNLLR